MSRLQLPMENIKRLYLEDKWDCNRIAEALGCGAWIIRRRLQEMGIPRGLYRAHSEETKRRISERKKALARQGINKIPIPEEELRRLYADEKLSAEAIAKRFGCSANVILRRLEAMGIPRRSVGDYLRKEISRLSDGKGYMRIRCPEHQRANPNGYVYEHIKVWEEAHGKSLPEGWVIHHLNGIRDDNRPSNLVGMPKIKHDRRLDPYKKRIRELEIENRQLRRALEDGQMLFNIGEN